MAIRDEAAAALAARRAAEEAALEAAEQALRQAAIAALRAVLDKGDGTPAVGLATLTQEHVDLDERLVIVTDETSDPSVSLAVQDLNDDGEWKVHLVALDAGAWVQKSGPLASLADIGGALEERAV